MSFLVRKITKSKWSDDLCKQISKTEDIKCIPADAITSCLRTTKNTLSLWEIKLEDHLEEAALALITCADRIENIDLIYIDSSIIEEMGFTIDKDSPGNTVVEDLKKTHRDLCKLDYSKIGDFALIVAKSISYSKYKRFTKKQLIHIIKEAINKGRLNLNDLNEKMQEDIKKHL